MKHSIKLIEILFFPYSNCSSSCLSTTCPLLKKNQRSTQIPEERRKPLQMLCFLKNSSGSGWQSNFGTISIKKGKIVSIRELLHQFVCCCDTVYVMTLRLNSLDIM